MKKPFSFLLLTAIALVLSIVFKFNAGNKTVSYQITDDCPPEGNSKNERVSQLNKLKNRTAFPQKKDFDTLITLKKILEPGDDAHRWDVTKAVSITGYVYDVKPGGVETCNCKDPDTRDTHIEILTDPMKDSKQQRMIVEVTPRMRKLMLEKGINWDTKVLRDKLLGRWVKFEGWLLFDEEHQSQAENTKPGRERNWRASAWEIHPVTKIEITTKPRN